MTSDDFPSSEVVAKLNKAHADLLNENETFVAACASGAIDQARPTTVFGRFGALGRMMTQALNEDRIVPRMNQIQLHMHRRGLEAVEFPPSKSGYLLALTQQRVIMFDDDGKKMLVESPIRNMAVERVGHADEMSSLLFVEGRQAAAVTAWEEPEVIEHFVTMYNQLHQAARLQRRAG